MELINPTQTLLMDLVLIRYKTGEHRCCTETVPPHLAASQGWSSLETELSLFGRGMHIKRKLPCGEGKVKDAFHDVSVSVLCGDCVSVLSLPCLDLDHVVLK